MNSFKKRFVIEAISFGILLLLVMLNSCNFDTPSGAPHDNPLDKNNQETSGDPFQLTAEAVDGFIHLRWSDVNIDNLTGYAIFRQENNSEYEDTLLIRGQTFYTDTSIVKGNRYKYGITGYTANGFFKRREENSIVLSTNPVFVIEDVEDDYTATRFVDLNIYTFTATRMKISNSSDFIDSDWVDYTTSKSWQLETGAGMKTVYFQVVFTEGDTSDVISDSIMPAPINPEVTINNNSEFTETPIVSLNIESTGAAEMRLSNKNDAGGDQWQVYEDELDWVLSTGEGTKTVQVSVRNDFLIEEVCSDQIEPRLCLINEFQLGVTDTTETNIVEVLLDADYSDHMQVSNSEDFAGAVWIPYQSNFTWDLGRGEVVSANGSKISPNRDATVHTLYSRVRNSFEIISPTLYDEITVEIFGGIEINDGNDFALSRLVNLSLVAPEADSIAVSNDSLIIFDDPVWIAFTGEIENWELETGPGTKVVYTRFKNRTGAESGVYFDSIEPMSMEPEIILNGGNHYTPFRVALAALRANGQIDSMKVGLQQDLEDLGWIEFRNQKLITLQFGEGIQIVSAFLKNDFEIVSEIVSAEIEPLPINPSIEIIDQNQDGFTSVRLLDLRLTAGGARLKMIISEDSTFESSEIVNFETEPQFLLSSGSTEKTIYAKIINDFEIVSEIVSDSILPFPLNPGLIINDGEEITNNNLLQLTMPDVGALEMKVSESDEFDEDNWGAYIDTVFYEISDGNRVLYAKFRHEFFESDIVSDTIIIDSRSEIEEFTYSSESEPPFAVGDRIYFELNMLEDLLGFETGGRAVVTIQGIENEIILDDMHDGSYSAVYEIPAETATYQGVVSLSFTDRAGNVVETMLEEHLDVYFPGFENEFPFGNDTITMVYIPPGQFRMGAQGEPRNREEGAQDNEFPGHQVTIINGFWMSKYEVTQGQWQMVLGNNPAEEFGVGGNYPIYNVSWNDIQNFESRLDNTYRLPSESEWEYACRAGSLTRFYWGDDPDEELLNDYSINQSNDNSSSEPVGTKLPNAWGLYDMIGNVIEYCEDNWHDNYDSAPEDGTPWIGGQFGDRRVTRGGSWGTWPAACRTAARNWLTDDVPARYNGFRVVRDLQD